MNGEFYIIVSEHINMLHNDGENPIGKNKSLSGQKVHFLRVVRSTECKVGFLITQVFLLVSSVNIVFEGC